MIQRGIYTYLKQWHPSELAAYEMRKIPLNYVVDEFSDTSENDYISNILRKDRLFQRYLADYIHELLKQPELPLFNKIELETINRCNNDCAFCPASLEKERRQLRKMDDALFQGIVEQLAKLRYHGVISLFSNNEPLLDPLLPERLRFVRKKLPDAVSLLSTNGLLLTPTVLPVLLESTDFLHINCYGETSVLPERLKKIQAALIQQRVDPEKVEIHIRNKSERLSTRAGNAPNRMHPAQLISMCILPFSQMVVRPDGAVSLCCNDVYGEYTLGDLNKDSLEQIWRGGPFRALRETMQKGRGAHPACRKCDMLYMPLAWEERERRGGV